MEKANLLGGLQEVQVKNSSHKMISNEIPSLVTGDYVLFLKKTLLDFTFIQR